MKHARTSAEQIDRDARAIEAAHRGRARAIAMAIQDKADALVENHGSIMIIRLNSQAARDWADDNIGTDAQYFGRHGLVVEPRYAHPIVAGMREAGLEVI